MIREISHKIIEYISENNYSNEEKEEMEYILNTIIFEILKILFTVIIFSIIGYFKESLIIVSIMAVTKPYIGGYHEDSQLKCFLATMLLTAGIIFMSMQTTFTFLSNGIILLVCIFCMYHQIPVINPNIPITRSHLIQKNKINGLRNISLVGIMSVILYKYTNYYCIITWVIIFQTILLFNKKENIKE